MISLATLLIAASPHVWEKQEIVLAAQGVYANPYSQVEVWADLKGPGYERRCYGFWDGGTTFRIRVMATAPGTWTWTTGSTPADAGLSKSGTFDAAAWSDAEKEANPNRRGIVRPTANGHALEYPDGTPFFLTADTWWATATFRWPWRDSDTPVPIGSGAGFKDYLRYRKAQGFNGLAVIASFPAWAEDGLARTLSDKSGILLRSQWASADMHDEDNNRPFAFPGKAPGYPNVVPDFDRINPAYFQNFDRKMQYLSDQGFTVFLEAYRRDLAPAWKAYGDWPASNIRYVQYLRARYQTQNVIFSPVHFDSKNNTLPVADILVPVKAHYQKYGAPAFGQLVSTNITESTLKTWGADASPWLTLHMTGNSPRGSAIYPDLTAIFHASPTLPGLNGEPYYAGLGNGTATPAAGSLQDDRNCRSAMYGNVLSGGFAGHIYGGDGLWQGALTGSPTEWQAIAFPSGAQMGHLKAFILSEGKAYQALEPQPSLVAPAKTGTVDQEGGAYCARTADKNLFLLYFEKGAKGATLSGLAPQGGYRAQWFDPRSGQWSDAGSGKVTADGAGAAALPDFPAGGRTAADDWALKLSLGSTSTRAPLARRAVPRGRRLAIPGMSQISGPQEGVLPDGRRDKGTEPREFHRILDVEEAK